MKKSKGFKSKRIAHFKGAGAHTSANPKIKSKPKSDPSPIKKEGN